MIYLFSTLLGFIILNERRPPKYSLGSRITVANHLQYKKYQYGFRFKLNIMALQFLSKTILICLCH